jgi:hypothetical protein
VIRGLETISIIIGLTFLGRILTRDGRDVNCYYSRFKVQGSRFKVQGSRFKVQGSRFKVQGSRFRVQRFRVQRRRWPKKRPVNSKKKL